MDSKLASFGRFIAVSSEMGETAANDPTVGPAGVTVAMPDLIA